MPSRNRSRGTPRIANRILRRVRDVAEVRHSGSITPSVAEEALETLLLSARHITVRVHPDDHTLVAQGASETLAARGARLVADASISRGGCLVESDIGIIDGSLETRWRRAAAALGSEAPFDAEGGA